MPNKTVFISHISQEAELAKGLKEKLEIHFLGMLDIFVSSDRETIQAGSNWLQEVDRALKEADVQIILCSKDSVNRPWVNFEAGAAWIRGIPVIPACHSGMKPKDLPVPLGMLEGITCSDQTGLQKLYDSLAKVLEVKPPSVDFGEMALQMNVLEKKYMQGNVAQEIINNPRILCAATEQYAEPRLGFHNDLAILERAFPGRVVVEKKLTKRRLLELLSTNQFDILHLVLGVNPENGDLIFSAVDESSRPVSPNPELMSPKGFADLLLESQAKLVVLATCNALLLAVEIARYTNMAASDTILTAQKAEEWCECFYSLLAQGKPLFRAFDLVKEFSDAPIRAIRHRDVVFSLGNGSRV